MAKKSDIYEWAVIDCALAAARAKFVFSERLTKTIESSGSSGCRVGFAPTGKAPPNHGARQEQSVGTISQFARYQTVGSSRYAGLDSIAWRQLPLNFYCREAA
jgi:hypothetical protein